MKDLEKLIEGRLNATKIHCDFKIAWLPKGWTCVYIKKFAKELAREIKR